MMTIVESIRDVFLESIVFSRESFKSFLNEFYFIGLRDCSYFL